MVGGCRARRSQKSKFYFIGNYKGGGSAAAEFELIRDLLLDLLNYNNFNIYIHNGIRFDLVFLFKHFIKVAKESKFNVDVVYKDGEILNLSIRNKKNIIQFKDSLKLLLSSLSNLAKNFGLSGPDAGKGVFPSTLRKLKILIMKVQHQITSIIHLTVKLY